MLNGVRLAYYETVAARRATAIERERFAIYESAVGTTAQMANVGQANAPDLLQAQIEARR